MTELTHAGEARGTEFKKVMRSPLFWGLTLLASIVAGAAAGIYFNPAAGAVAFAAAFVFVFICGFAYAKAMAAQSFHDGYAKSRGLIKSERQLGKLTPLLSHGADQRTDLMLSGPLKEGFDGSLALFTSTDRHLDDQRNETRKDNPSTVVHIEIAETAARLPELIAHRRSGARALDSVEDRFRSEHQRVKLESEALDTRFEIFVGKNQDPNFVRQVFSPSFIVWLTESKPEELAFELVAGNLVVSVPGYRDTTEGFDEMIEAGCAVAARLRDEAAE